MGCLHDDELPTFFLFFFIASDSHGIPRLLFLTLHKKGICTTLVRFSSRHEHEIMGFDDDGNIKLMGMNEFTTYFLVLSCSLLHALAVTVVSSVVMRCLMATWF